MDLLLVDGIMLIACKYVQVENNWTQSNSNIILDIKCIYILYNDFPSGVISHIYVIG